MKETVDTLQDPRTAKERAEPCGNCGHSRGNHLFHAIGGKRPCYDGDVAETCRCTAFVQRTNATEDAAPMNEMERRRRIEQANCTHDRSGVWCRKCGHVNQARAKEARDNAAAEAYARECLGADRVTFSAGFEAGYAYANELLKSFYAI